MKHQVQMAHEMVSVYFFYIDNLRHLQIKYVYCTIN